MPSNTSNSTNQAFTKLSQEQSRRIPKGAILVPVDFYPHSEAAVEYAAELADLMKTPLVILHVVHDPVDVPGFYTQEKKAKRLRRMEDIGAEMLEEFIQKMANQCGDGTAIKNAYSKLVIGLPTTRIIEVVKQIQAKVVVMGSQGRTGLGLAFVGSTAKHVMRQSPVPVTIVKARKDTLEEV